MACPEGCKWFGVVGRASSPIDSYARPAARMR